MCKVADIHKTYYEANSFYVNGVLTITPPKATEQIPPDNETDTEESSTEEAAEHVYEIALDDLPDELKKK